MIIIFLFFFITKPFVNPSKAKRVSLLNRWLSLSVPTSLSFFSFSHEPPSSTLSKSFNIFDFLNLSKNPKSVVDLSIKKPTKEIVAVDMNIYNFVTKRRNPDCLTVQIVLKISGLKT
ncbi:hypothetical protein QQP08_003973 [Theobroma cacao]|nr:hypothetical protein QQP08_003973 [Theobroma cacao]